MSTPRSTRSRLGPSFGLAVVLTASLAQGADPQQPPVIPIGTEVVRVAVIVTDRGGGAIRALTPEDSELLEDGQPQQITSCAAYAGRVAAPPPRGAPPAPPVASEPSASRPAQ